MDSLKIQHIKIEGIGGIINLELDFKDGLNLICGTNGIGKTTILECISHAFINKSTDQLKRNVNSEKGVCYINYKDQEVFKQMHYELTHFNPIGDKDYLSVLQRKSQNILVFNTKRSFSYMDLQNLSRDPERGDYQSAGIAYTGVSAGDIKNWFVQRFMWSAHKDILQEEQFYNFEKAKECFNILDERVLFSRVIPDTYDIMINSQQGEVYFEYLSAGYKSCIYILLGIIKEIEFRFKNPYVKVTDFSGIILIDEIDVHLHPQWQKNLIISLKKLLPNAQIIATTHSPSMVQCVEANEIIPLQFDENNNIFVKDFAVSKYGFQGWSIEEILTDVMGMESVRSDIYNKTMRQFDMALDNDDIDMAKQAYHELDQMLHPNNPLRKLLEIQMIGVEEDD